MKVKLIYLNGQLQICRRKTGGQVEDRDWSLHRVEHTRSSSRDMNTTLSTLFLIAGSTGAAMSNGLLVCGFVLFWKRQETGKLRLVTFSRVAPNASSLPAVVARQESAERLLWAVGTVQYDLRVHCYLCFVLMA